MELDTSVNPLRHCLKDEEPNIATSKLAIAPGSTVKHLIKKIAARHPQLITAVQAWVVESFVELLRKFTGRLQSVNQFLQTSYSGLDALNGKGFAPFVTPGFFQQLGLFRPIVRSSSDSICTTQKILS